MWRTFNPFPYLYGTYRRKLTDADANVYPHKTGMKINEEMIADAFGDILAELGIDWDNDPATKETPARFARMIKEVCWGKYTPAPRLTDFENVCSVNQMYTVGPIEIRSLCSHHFVPIMGQVWIGVIPSTTGRVLGLSKFARLTEWMFARPIMQENTTHELANEIWNVCDLRGLGIVVRASHMCASWRGVQQTNMSMITSEMKGVFLKDHKVKEEFLSMIKGQEF